LHFSELHFSELSVSELSVSEFPISELHLSELYGHPYFTIVVRVETMYNMISMDYPRKAPLLYNDGAKKCPLFFSGAEGGESPHDPAGSCMYQFTV
jgi:hypothetical protein